MRARSEQGTLFEWQGRFALAPQVNSQGKFSIASLRAPKVAEFLGDALPFGLSSGVINLAGTYDVTAGGVFKLQAEMPRIELTSLGLRARGVATDWVEIPSLLLTDTHIALPAQTVGIANITLAGTKAQLWVNADGSRNIDQLLGSEPATTQASTAPAVGAEGATTQASTAPAVVAEATQVSATTTPVPAASRPADQSSPWQLSVTALDVRDASIDLEDRSLAPAVKFAIKPLNVGLQEVTLDLTKPLPIKFDATINGKGSLTGSGRLAPDPIDAEIDIRLDGFDLRDVQPYVAASTDMTITRGTFGLTGKLGMAPSDGNVPKRSFAGDVKVTGFRSIDNALEQEFFACEGLELTKVHFATLPNALSIDRVRVVRPFNRVIVGSNQILNVSAVFDPEGTAATIKANEAAAAAAQAATARKKSRAEIKAEKAAKAKAAKARAAAPPVPAPELKETGMPIRIRELSIENGRMDFADFSIQPNFAADVTDLNGHVRGMSSDPNAHAKVDIKGKVGDFSPVTITGEVQPFAYDRHTDIGLKFENISLPIFNPYSGKFAGYNIAKGKLTTDLHYTIDERKLAASHKIRIDQLEWGEATAAKGEATLPVKFATSLLKDVDGVINLDVPVKGTIDDPKFRIGPIVWQIIRNILTKAVTAPFRALGALFKDAEKAQFVDFDPGQAALDAPTTERLAGLAKTLAPKSDIRLDVPIGTWAEFDRAALAAQRYDAELLGAMQRTLRGKKATADEPVPAFDTLDQQKKIAVLTELVQHVAGAPPEIPEQGERAEGMSRKEARAAYEAATIEYLTTEARSRITPSDGDIDQLGQRRAEAVQKALLADTGLDPQRVFLVKDGKVTPQDGKVRFELAMQ